MQTISTTNNGYDFISAQDISNSNSSSLQWIVNGLLPEGVAILSGKPKSGKSMLALDIALAVSKGTKALDSFDTVASSVLYLPYDDNEGRLKERIHHIESCLAASPETPFSVFFPVQPVHKTWEPIQTPPARRMPKNKRIPDKVGEVIFFGVDQFEPNPEHPITKVIPAANNATTSAQASAKADRLNSFRGATRNIRFLKFNDSALDELAGVLNECPDIKLIIIDSLEAAFHCCKGKYGNCYRDAGSAWMNIKEFALNHHVCMLFLRQRKQCDRRTDFDVISHLADVQINLKTSPQKNDDDITTLHICGRDVPESSFTCEFNHDTFRWNISNGKPCKALNKERWDIVELFKNDFNLRYNVREIAQFLNKNLSAVSRLLHKMTVQGILCNPMYGIYGLTMSSKDYSDLHKR